MFRKFGKTQIITAVGIVMALAAAALAVLGETDLTLFFLAVGALTLIVTVGIIHRYLVATRRATNRQFSRLQKQIERHEELTMGDYPEFIASSGQAQKQAQAKKAPTDNKAKAPSGPRKAVSTQNKAPSAQHATSPLFSRMLSEHDRGVVVARTIKESPKAAARFALKVKSVKLRDYFALAASGNFYSYPELIAIIHRCRANDSTESDTIKQWDVECLIALAQVLGNQRLKETDLEDARLILTVVVAVFGKKALPREDRVLLAEIVGECGDWETAAFILEEFGLKKSNLSQYQFTVANRYAGSGGDPAKWLESVNRVYSDNGFLSLSLPPSTATNLDQLNSESLSANPVDGGPLVSVIVPTYEGADRIETALKSLVAQTWKNLEIIVVDDGSSNENVDKLKRIVAGYPSVRLVPLESNTGAYVARNEGLRQASGELVTVHDDDDWSHPQKIAEQVEYLLEHENLAGTISKHARVTEDLKFTRINRRPMYSQNNMSSLLLRTVDARKLGGWDEVNRGADEEFTLRLQRVSGKKIACCSEVPLSFTRTHERSLTSGEILRGFQDPSRMLYHSAFTEAHKRVDESHPEAQGVPLPADMEAGSRGADFGQYDYGFVLDTKTNDFTLSAAIAELREMDRLGYRVAVIHHHSLEGATSPLVAPTVLNIIKETGVEFLSFKNRAEFEYLIVRDARAFEFGECTPTNLKPKNLAIVPSTGEQDEAMVVGIDEHALNCLSTVFNRAASEIKVLRDWVGLAPYEQAALPSWEPGEKLVVGRGSAATPQRWPSKVSDLREVYGSNELYDVLLVDDFDHNCARIEETVRAGACLVSVDDYDRRSFLSEIDFWVDMGEPHSSASEDVLSAIAAGVVVVLRSGAEEVYGDAVLFAKPNDVRTVLKRIREFPLLYDLQRERGLNSLPEMWDRATFDKFLDALREK